MLKVCCIRPSNTGVDYHRLEIPFTKLAQTYKDIKWFGSYGFTLNNLPTNFDVIVLNRASRQPEPYIQMAKDAGVKIILDLDDWIELPNYHISHDGIDTPLVEERIKENIALADEIWCASEFLAHRMSYIYSGSIKVIPNAIDFEQPQFIPQHRKHDRYTIGYIAGAGHHRDVDLLYHPLQNILGQRNYNLLISGYEKNAHTDYWNYIIQIFTSAGLLNKSQFIIEDWADCYNYAFPYNLCDLMLAPLENSLFNQCKSNLKVLEAGAFSLPIICSNIEPYKEFIKQGLVYVSEGGWDKRIKDLIKHPEKGRNMGKRLNEYVREHYNIEKINKIRYESILSVMDSWTIVSN